MNYFLVWFFHMWQTDGKRCLRAHGTLVKVGSKTSSHSYIWSQLSRPRSEIILIYNSEVQGLSSGSVNLNRNPKSRQNHLRSPPKNIKQTFMFISQNCIIFLTITSFATVKITIYMFSGTGCWVNWFRNLFKSWSILFSWPGCNQVLLK